MRRRVLDKQESWGIDSCHVQIIGPSESEDSFLNRKGFYSINLAAIVDENYRFLWCSAGRPGPSHDSRVLRKSQLAYNKAMLRFRACVEQSFDQLKRQFHALHKRLRYVYSLAFIAPIFTAVCLRSVAIRQKEPEFQDDFDYDDSENEEFEDSSEDEGIDSGTATTMRAIVNNNFY
ncbi:hypothetical protein ANCDUO_17136 [Ancylostoma duodenale]|uniref:DDE Tnp4 domain-containing protein n=1 Tax=Ancylostoma duodenale TaxID=51022 RepID=A0A0C2G6Q8_9BILA|nr:hypothetical protein ANCDUO_17136 [Ancylostoma duodenale]